MLFLFKTDFLAEKNGKKSQEIRHTELEHLHCHKSKNAWTWCYRTSSTSSCWYVNSPRVPLSTRPAAVVPNKLGSGNIPPSVKTDSQNPRKYLRWSSLMSQMPPELETVLKHITNVVKSYMFKNKVLFIEIARHVYTDGAGTIWRSADCNIDQCEGWFIFDT